MEFCTQRLKAPFILPGMNSEALLHSTSMIRAFMPLELVIQTASPVLKLLSRSVNSSLPTTRML